MREHHVIGPPGTGKTTYVARQAGRAVERYGPDRVMIASLTKAAAREAAGRDTLVERIGTLHSICLHALDRPTLIGPAHIKAWNECHPWWSLPTDIVTGDTTDRSGEPAGETLYSTYQLMRARMRDRRFWPVSLRTFADAWEAFKQDGDLWDYTDLIERALTELPYAPGGPEVIFADEVQDFSRLELTLLRRWAQDAEQLVLVGDPLQALYDWRGADPEVFSGEPASRHVLSQSWRLPRAVHERATRIVRDLLAGVEYEPRDAAGTVLSGAGLRNFIPGEEPCMVLAACEYMLAPIVKSLRSAGIPYHNPYNRRWNPLRPTGTLGRLLAFTLNPAGPDLWDPKDLARWVPMLRATCFRGSKKEALDRLEEAPALLSLFTEDTLDAAADAARRGDVGWLIDHSTNEYQRAAEYPARVLAQRGAARLRRELSLPPRRRPWHIVGTIHSVKGGEADRVLVFPDLSPAGHKQARTPGWSGRDSVRRQFYVAMTRARETLVIGEATGLRIQL